MSRDDALLQTQEAVTKLSEQLGAILSDVSGVFIDAARCLYEAFGPVHRELQFIWLVKRGIPIWLARCIADRAPRRWLTPLDVLAQDLQEGGRDASRNDDSS